MAPTLLLYAPSNNAGHAINGQARLGYLTLEHLVKEAPAWGMDKDHARDTTVSILESVAAVTATSETPERLGFLKELIPARVDDLISGGTTRRDQR